ncbi:MAG: hypothetical protein DHS20C17_08150 [Cyclobacteriaceae bacterium]|nr:MAG: hypothetical protein DHS20C17_08150 [Cyclobacteriaceae bacterium]
MNLGRIILIFLLPTSCLAQVYDNFSDGDFTSAPPWSGNSKSFIINSDHQLQLNASGPGTAYLSTTSFTSIAATWQFEVRLTFNPSARNFCRIYLISDSPNLSNALNGYYVSIGGSSDDVSLFRQDQSGHHKILDGQDGATDTSSVVITVRVTRDATNKWSLYTKSNTGQHFLSSGTVEDGIHQKSNYFGFYCQFTTSRSTGFYLDNIQVEGTSYIDRDPPELLSLKPIGDDKLEILFSEPIETPALSLLNVKGKGHPIDLLHKPTGTWELTFPFRFENGMEYYLEINGIQDPQGNSLFHSRQFRYWKSLPAQLHDVIISEIMADPEPSLLLPGVEYIEIYNRSNNAINLLNWSLSDATKSVGLPEFLLLPGSYLVLSAAVEDKFPNEPNHIIPNGWPTLNNSGDIISLTDSSGNFIHLIEYTDAWYRSNLRQHGGWSLEMIDINYPCSGGLNWAASSSFSGGTPGFANSIATDNPDLTPPVMVKTYAPNSFTLNIYFDQQLRSDLGSSTSIFLEPELTIDTFYLPSPEKPQLVVLLKDSLELGVIYNVTASGFADCNNNLDLTGGTHYRAGLELPADSGDLVINEILFNPRPLGTRFIEVYNRSYKPINLKNWRFSGNPLDAIVEFKLIVENDLMIFPGDYLAFTENPDQLISQYPKSSNAVLVKVNELPSINNKGGSIALIAPDGMIVDQLNYHEGMHHSLLFDTEGVSLERADPESPTSDPNNWYSGSEAAGYATPGRENSQLQLTPSPFNFAVEPNIISPLSSHLPAYAQISFNLDQPGTSGSVSIYNQQGNLVKTLVNNSLLPVSGVYQWDGSDNKGKRVPMGYYIVLFKLSQPDHGSKIWKGTVVVAPDY